MFTGLPINPQTFLLFTTIQWKKQHNYIFSCFKVYLLDSPFWALQIPLLPLPFSKVLEPLLNITLQDRLVILRWFHDHPFASSTCMILICVYILSKWVQLFYFSVHQGPIVSSPNYYH